MDIEKYVSTLIINQMPDFYREEGPNFLQFVKAYYEWLEQDGNVTFDSRRLPDYRDIDETLDEFVDHFQQKYMVNLPKNLLSDKRFLQKHILDVYRSKGSIQGLKLLFVLLYNEDVDVYIPSIDILKTSDGKWIEPKYIEVAYSEYNSLYQGKVVTGSESRATAVVDSYEEKLVGGRPVYVMYVSSVEGNFLPGELLFTEGVQNQVASRIIGSTTRLEVTSSTPGFNVGEYVNLRNSEGVVGEKMRGIVSSTTTKSGVINFRLIDGGSGYSNAANIQITAGTNTTGSGATFVISTLSNTSVFSYVNQKVLAYQNVALNATNYKANVADVTNMATSNLSTILQNALNFTNVTVGTISGISVTNPGIAYNGSVTVTITDPYTYTAKIPDGKGGFWGQNSTVLGDAEFGNGVVQTVKIIDSGFGYYANGQNVTFEAESNSALTFTADRVDTGVGWAEGFWKDTESFLNSNKYIQDSYYYQEYSYEVQTPRTLEKYKNVLKRLYHPVGNELFGKAVFTSTQNNVFEVAMTQVTQS